MLDCVVGLPGARLGRVPTASRTLATGGASGGGVSVGACVEHAWGRTRAGMPLLSPSIGFLAYPVFMSEPDRGANVMNQRTGPRGHSSEVSYRGVRQALGCFLVMGLLGLPSGVGATSEATKEPPPPEPAKCERHHRKVVVDFCGKGIVFNPSPCLEVGGQVRFINLCKEETLVTVDGPGPHFDLSLPPEVKSDRLFKEEGVYVIRAAEGCPEMPHDSRTGTLEVATGPGPEKGASP